MSSATMSSPLVVPFAYPDPRGNNYDEWSEIVERALGRYRFWDAPTTVEWFQARGYTLYERFNMDPKDQTAPDPSCTGPRMKRGYESSGQYPYAYYDDFKLDEDELDLVACEQSGSLVFAQDEQGRHVAIKLVPNGSDELRIYELIHAQDVESLKEHCILPILEILRSTTHSFVVMPRWGGDPITPPLASLLEVLAFIHCLLKALAFLHKNNIVHRDISTANIVTNHFSTHESMWASEPRKQLRREQLASYALIDFNYSAIVPDGVEPSKFRLPAEKAFDAAYAVPDTAQGEVDYDPFAWDVCSLGALMATQYQYFCYDLPFLAPLFDSMITIDVSRRFTAAQALEFFESEVASLHKGRLTKPIWMPDDRTRPCDYDRWKYVPKSLAVKWKSYRSAEITPWVRFLRRVCAMGDGKGYIIVMTIRRCIRFILGLIGAR
ncbi:other/AgaK1 protein kinase [Coprinopsis cinerea AmutBmut pab1-1]|nr:other/AgaK1 protein kinase [Coprinopsis cinerea AmutBmut pab1-1]